MVERKIDRLHTRVVTLGVADAVVAVVGCGGFDIQLFFQLAEKSIEEVDLKSIRFFDDLADFVVDHADEGNRPPPLRFGGPIDDVDDRTGFFGGVDKGVGSPLEFDVAELVEQGFADIFSGQAGTVGNIKDIACDGHGVFSLVFRTVSNHHSKRTAGNKAGKL